MNHFPCKGRFRIGAVLLIMLQQHCWETMRYRLLSSADAQWNIGCVGTQMGLFKNAVDSAAESARRRGDKWHVFVWTREGAQSPANLAHVNMATIKFKDPSPFSRRQPEPPSTDLEYASFINHFTRALKDQDHGDKVQIALFGAGRAGTIHLSGLVVNPRVDILYIVDDVESKWGEIRRYWKLSTTQFLSSRDADKVFRDPRVQAVIVATPTDTHESIVTQAVSHGKDVFCEKPVAQSIEAAERCYQRAKEAGRLLFCAFQRRFDPSFAHIKERVRAGEVGHIHVIKSTSRDAQLPSVDYLRTSSGVFHDSAIHDIDLLCWITGEYPTRVTVQASANFPEVKAIGDFDTTVITFQFPSGTLGIIDTSRSSVFGYDQRIEVFGPRGMLSCTNERPMVGVESQIGLQGGSVTPIYYSFPSRYKTAYLREMDHFLNAVQGKVAPAILGHETIAASKIAAACEKSAKTGQYVHLEWTDEDIPPK